MVDQTQNARDIADNERRSGLRIIPDMPRQIEVIEALTSNKIINLVMMFPGNEGMHI